MGRVFVFMEKSVVLFFGKKTGWELFDVVCNDLLVFSLREQTIYEISDFHALSCKTIWMVVHIHGNF